MRVRVKVCGITRVEDALAAAEAGADAIGLVFADSPRRVTIEAADRIVRCLPPFVCPVGVFVDAPKEDLLRTVEAVGLHCVQLHGNESPGYAESLGSLKSIKAVRVASPQDVRKADDYATMILFDSASKEAAGGTGEAFPWEYVGQVARRRPVVLAGGLTADNVARALSMVPAWGVDVSTGVESSRGVKDPAKIRLFIDSVRRATDAQPGG